MLKRLLCGVFFAVITICGPVNFAFADVTCSENQVLVDGQCYNGKFAIKTTSMSANDTFKFSISARGTFYVYCGDDGVLSGSGVGQDGVTIIRSGTTMAQYTCTYTDAGTHIIRFGGTATGYYASLNSWQLGLNAAIGFSTSNMSGNTPTKIASISGSLGAIFPTLNDGANNLAYQPRFLHTFAGCSGLQSLPSGLFNGISGAADVMFYGTFTSCTNLTTVPYNLFAGVSGTPGIYMFYQTFYNDTKLNTFVLANGTTVNYVPYGFFGSINGTATDVMTNIFYKNTAIADTCPEDMTQAYAEYASSWNGRVACFAANLTVTLYQNETDNDNTINATVATANGLSLSSKDKSGNTLTPPTRSGYIFTGYWSARSGGTKYYDSDMIPTHIWDSDNNGSLYAQWLDPSYEFTITTTNMTANDTFKFSMSAAGEFYIDWGDGTTQYIDRANDTTQTQYSHKYTNAGIHTIRFGGSATGYNASRKEAIGFSTANTSGNTPTKIASISGSLGAIFPTLNNGSNNLAYQPSFVYTFYRCTGLTSLPSTLFNGISGAANSMFSFTFYGCTGLTTLPSGLFNGISGAANNMFEGTFSGCSGLQSLPSDLFHGVSGAASYMFNSTFFGCSGLTSLPSGLFNGISGAADHMFASTFASCSGLQSLPSGLFNGISGAAGNMFESTFQNCTNLTTVPYNLFSGASGTPGGNMFQNTFYNDTLLNTFVLANGTSTVNYISTEFFGFISGGKSNVMQDVFYGNTVIASSCPANTYQYFTGYESQLNGRVSCKVCPNNGTSAAGSTSVMQCDGSTINLSWYKESDDQSTYDTSVCVFGESIDLPTQPTKAGYNFLGWTVDTNAQ